MAEISVPTGIKELVEVTNPALLQRLRDAVAPPGKKGSWLKFLNDNQLLEVFYRLQQGQPPHSIVVLAQKEWRVKPTSQANSLARSLRKFREDVVGDIMNADLTTEKKKEEARNLTRRGQRISKDLDAMEHLADLIIRSEDRLNLVRTIEERTKIPFKNADTMIKNHGDLLAQFINLQIKLGLRKQVPAELHVGIQHRFKGLMETTVKDDGEKIVQAADRMLKKLEEKALTFKVGSDGKYHFDGVTNGPEQSDPGNGGAPNS